MRNLIIYLINYLILKARYNSFRFKLNFQTNGIFNPAIPGTVYETLFSALFGGVSKTLSNSISRITVIILHAHAIINFESSYRFYIKANEEEYGSLKLKLY